MKRTIYIHESLSADATPDLIEISLNILGRDKDYKKAYRQADQSLERSREALKQLSLDATVSEVNISQEFSSVQDDLGNYRNVFQNYLVSFDLKVSFNVDMELLSQVLETLTQSLAEPLMQISFLVKDPQKIRDSLLKQAVKAASKKALILAEAAGQTLGEVLSISLSSDDIAAEHQFRSMKAAGFAAPSEVSITASIDITYRIR